MNPKEQVCSLELSKQLKEAGYPQEGLFWWVFPESESRPMLFFGHRDNAFNKSNHGNIIVASTVAELLDKFPHYIETDDKLYVLRCMKKRKAGYIIQYADYRIETDDKELNYTDAITLSNALAKMWLYLKKEGLL